MGTLKVIFDPAPLVVLDGLGFTPILGIVNLLLISLMYYSIRDPRGRGKCVILLFALFFVNLSYI